MYIKILLIICLIFLTVIIYLQKPTPCVELPVYISSSSKIKGRGVFASRPIKSGETIEHCPLILFNRKFIDIKCEIRDYDITYDDYKHAVILGYGSIYNHSDDNNAEWHFENEELVITAKKDINFMQEIFVSYGTNYWKFRQGKI